MKYERNGIDFDITKEHQIGDVIYPIGWFLDPLNRVEFGIIEKVIPVHTPTAAEIAEQELKAKLQAIATLEDSITSRRIRDALLTQAGKDWIAGVETSINAIRITI